MLVCDMRCDETAPMNCRRQNIVREKEVSSNAGQGEEFLALGVRLCYSETGRDGQ